MIILNNKLKYPLIYLIKIIQFLQEIIILIKNNSYNGSYTKFTNNYSKMLQLSLIKIIKNISNSSYISDPIT